MTLSKYNFFHHRVASIFDLIDRETMARTVANQQQLSPGSPDIKSTRETTSRPFMTLFSAGLCERQVWSKQLNCSNHR